MTTVGGSIENHHPMTAGIPCGISHVKRRTQWTHHCAYHDCSHGQRSTKTYKHHQSRKQDASDPDVVPERQRPIAVARASVSGTIAVVQHVIAHCQHLCVFSQAQPLCSVFLLRCTSSNIHETNIMGVGPCPRGRGCKQAFPYSVP